MECELQIMVIMLLHSIFLIDFAKCCDIFIHRLLKETQNEEMLKRVYKH